MRTGTNSRSARGESVARLARSALSKSITYIVIGAAILAIDIATGQYLQFPVLFVIPVGLCAWYLPGRLAYLLSVLLPLGRVLIAGFLESADPIEYVVVNGLIRVIVLGLIAYFVTRTSRQAIELKQKVDTLVTICAWSRTVKYENQWISFEEYLSRRFGIHTSHGISPAEADRLREELEREKRS